jgi:hypothetical protein
MNMPRRIQQPHPPRRSSKSGPAITKLPAVVARDRQLARCVRTTIAFWRGIRAYDTDLFQRMYRGFRRNIVRRSRGDETYRAAADAIHRGVQVSR